MLQSVRCDAFGLDREQRTQRFWACTNAMALGLFIARGICVLLSARLSGSQDTLA